MKKVLLLLVAMCVISYVLAASWKWEKVNDSCNKCTITETERECGKCSSFLNQKDIKIEGNYIIYTYECSNSNCRHNCIFKKRFE